MTFRPVVRAPAVACVNSHIGEPDSVGNSLEECAISLATRRFAVSHVAHLDVRVTRAVPLGSLQSGLAPDGAMTLGQNSIRF